MRVIYHSNHLAGSQKGKRLQPFKYITYAQLIICYECSINMYGHSLQTYREYHSDIYPETNGYLAAMGPDDWWKSKCNNPVPKISLDPKKRPKTNLSNFNGKPLGERDSTIKNDNPVSPPQPVKPLPSGPVDSKVRFCLIFLLLV